MMKDLEKAFQLNDSLGFACRNNPELGGLLLDFRESIRKTDSAMLEFGVVAGCTRCAESGKGSCCFTEMGESFGFIGLFVNLLLGSVLPEKADFPGTCHFVGESGCKLQARQSFCLNYFCPDLKASLGSETIQKIQRQVGEQLQIGWELELALTRFISDADIKSRGGNGRPFD